MTSEKETTIIDEGKVTFGYARKRNLGNYENEEVSAYLTMSVPTALAAGFIGTQGEQHMSTLKAHVWNELGLDMEFDEAGNPTLTKAAPVTRVAPAAPAAVPQVHAAAPQPVAPVPAPIPQTPPAGGSGVAAMGVYAPPPGPCGDCGMNDWWDNRTDVDGRIQQNIKVGPDWKCKNKACNHGVFRPGTFAYNKNAGPRAAAPVVAQVAQQLAPPPAPAPAPPQYAPDEMPF